MKESSHLLHGSAPNTDTRRMQPGARRLLFFASERARDPRVVLIARERTGRYLPPGGGLSIPFPRAGIDPTSVDVTSAGRISTRTVLRRLAEVSRETGSQPPGSAPYLPLQSGGVRRDYRIRCASPMHGTRSAPARADVSSTLFHLSTTPFIPSDATYSTADLQYPYSSGVWIILTCYST